MMTPQASYKGTAITRAEHLTVVAKIIEGSALRVSRWLMSLLQVRVGGDTERADHYGRRILPA